VLPGVIACQNLNVYFLQGHCISEIDDKFRSRK